MEWYHLRTIWRPGELRECRSKVESSGSGKVESSAFGMGAPSAGCHSLIPECVSPSIATGSRQGRRGCAPKGSLDGWARCKTMFIEGMAANGNKITRSETILKAELSTLVRQRAMWRAARPVPSLARMDICGGMVKLVYTEALKASSPQGECGFDSHSRYQTLDHSIWARHLSDSVREEKQLR